MGSPFLFQKPNQAGETSVWPHCHSNPRILGLILDLGPGTVCLWTEFYADLFWYFGTRLSSWFWKSHKHVCIYHIYHRYSNRLSIANTVNPDQKAPERLDCMVYTICLFIITSNTLLQVVR